MTNNKEGVKDTVKVTGVKAGDTVRVYGVATKGEALGSSNSESTRKRNAGRRCRRSTGS
ncbi:hypothetical protein ACT7DA_12570 [Bacillus pacificus]